jgi:hypothetical protein
MTTTMKAMFVVTTLLGAACGLNREPSPTKLVQLQVSPPTASVPAGVDQQLTATAIFENGRRENVSGQVLWSIGDEAVAQVDASGRVTTAVPGTTRVSASLGGLSGSGNLAVSDATLVAIDLVPSVLRIPRGATLVTRAWGSYTDGSVVELTSQAAWSATTGALTPLTAGQSRAAEKGAVRLCARFQAMQADVEVEVTDAAPVALNVASNRNLGALPKGVISILTVSAEFTDQTVLDVTNDVTWRSSDLAVAEVVSSRVRGVGAGYARIGAAYLGMSTVVEIAVSSAEVVGLALYPPVATVPAGEFAELTARAIYSDGSVEDVNDQVTWSSLDPEAVEFDENDVDFGHAYGMMPGRETVVTVLLQGTTFSATTLVKVVAP